MALRLVKKVNSPDVSQDIDKPTSNPWRHVSRTGADVVSGALGSVGNVDQLLSSLANYAGEKTIGKRPFAETPFPTSESVRQRLEPYYEPGELRPQGGFESVVSNVISNLPVTLALAGTGSLGTAIARDVGATAASKGAESAGLGLPGQLLAGVVGGGIAGKGVSKIKNILGKDGSINNLSNLAETAKKQAYAQEAKLGEKITAPALEYQDKLLDLQSKIRNHSLGRGQLTSGEQGDLLHNLDLFINDARSGGIKASKLAERAKEINSLYNTGNPIYNRYLKQIKGIVQEKISDVGKKHPEWLGELQKANSIHQAQNFGVNLQGMLASTPQIAKLVTNPLAQSLLTAVTGGAGLGLGIGSVAGAGVGGVASLAGLSAAKKSAQLLGFLTKSSATRKLLSQAAVASAERNAPQLANIMLKINKEAEKYSQEAEKPTSAKGIRLVRKIS